MFEGDCPTCGGPVLLTTSRITEMEQGPRGILVRYLCWCGTPGTLLTGRRSQESPDEVAAAPLPA